MNKSRSKPGHGRADGRRKTPAWVAIVLLLLLAPALVFARYGLGWAAAEEVALIASWLTIVLIKPVTWRRGPRWSVVFFAFVMTTLVFAFAAMAVGLWLSPWWCLAISAATGTLSIVAVWPAQMRHYRVQRQLLDSDDPTS